jgi:putative transposase
MRKPYKSDLTDAQWALIEPLVPPAKPGGRPRETDMREVANTILHQARSGAQWDMLPNDLLAKSTVFDYFSAWKEDGAWQRMLDSLREEARVQEGREPTPSAMRIGSRSVKSTEAGGLGEADKAGYDGGKKTKGRKRHIVVCALGLLVAVAVTAANRDDGTAAPDVLAKIAPAEFPRLKVVYGDKKYNNRTLAQWLEDTDAPYEVQATMKPDDAPKGFVPVRIRWVAEQAIACLNRSRRLSRDFERTTESSEAWVKVSGIQRLLRRAAPGKGKKAEFNYPKKVKSDEKAPVS